MREIQLQDLSIAYVHIVCELMLKERVDIFLITTSWSEGIHFYLEKQS